MHKENEVLQMQSDIRTFLAVNFESEPTPFNAHRLGIYSEENKAIDNGKFNYKELVFLHSYIDMVCNQFRKKTLIDQMLENTDKYSSKLPVETYQAELSMIAWLGSNVGQTFLSRCEEKIKQWD